MRRIFVGGCERSGTSLVQKILASHSRIAGGPELVFTGRIAELHRRMSASYPPEYAARIAAFYERGELARAFRELFASLTRRVAEAKPGAAYLSEKTPSNIFAADPLLELFPDGRFVHVVRDGRDVLASHRGVRRRFERHGDAFWNRASFRRRRVCGRWNRAVEIHFALLGRGRYHWLRYEDLVRDPEPTLAGLFEFLELDLETAALAPEAIDAERLGMPIDGLWTTAETARRSFDPSRIGRWRHSLPLADRLLGSLLMAMNLGRLGYPVGAASVRASRALAGIRRTIRRRPPYRCAPAADRPSGRSGSSSG